MTPERWHLIASTYEAAVDLDPAARDEFLSEACARDHLLRLEVESLLRHDAADVVVDRPVLTTAASLLDDVPYLRSGSTLGPYRIEGLLGEGGMGRVFRSTDTRLNRQVAIKILPAAVGRDSHARARLIREATAVAALAHPHICTLYDIGSDDEIDYLVMECLEGDTLAARLAHGPLPLQMSLEYATQVASALAHAHQRRIVHRDLKPANIMVTAAGAKLLDFGISKLQVSASEDGSYREHLHAARVMSDSESPGRSERSWNETPNGAIPGTLRYMAPEQIDGGNVDARSDLFSFGAVVYEMLTGKRAFDGVDAAGIQAAIRGSHPRPIRSLQAHVPVAIDQIVFRCLAKNPAERWQQASDVVSALTRVTGAISQVGNEPASNAPGLRTWIAYILLAALTATGIWAVGTSRQPVSTQAFGEIRSIAVLPLESLSKDQEYFAAGITEQLTADLAAIRALRVISRTSALRYQNARKPVPVIARELQVDAVVEGSVTHASGRVQVTSKLIRGATGEIIWAQSFERDVRDVLTLQREIAGAISNKVGVTLTPESQVRLASARPVDPETHRQILLGRYQAAKSTEKGLHEAIKRFESVVSKDHGNALAHASLAEAYMGLSGYYLHPRQAMPKAKRAAETALELDDSLADAHAALGFIHLAYDWDGPGAERELLRALDLNPTLAMARLNYAAYLTSQGRPDNAVQEIRRAVQLDPLSIQTYSFGALFLLFARQYDEAIELARKGLEFEPNSAFTLAFQGTAYAEKSQYDQAIANLARAVQLDNSLTIRALQAHVVAAAGHHEQARALVGDIEKEARARYFCPYEIATVYVTLGDQDTATHWLRKGIDDRADCMPWLGVEPWMDAFRSDPRYVRLLKEIGLTPVPAPAR